MNLLELQTRANALVQKVNEYEETIAGVELDENEILNEHTYVDLFSLRMIMHRLFGTTPSDRSSNLTTTDGVTWYYLPTSKAMDLHLGNINENYYTYGSSSEPIERSNDNNDLYTNYNMLVIDPNLSNAWQYSDTSGDKQRLITSMSNTVFGADIRDALVTESQTANIFKWNTTSEDDVTSYASTYVVPQQVPGIVCYYLGSGYDGTYTATVPYNTSYSTNQPNNATPALYGAYYIDQNVGPGPSGITSQQAENRGAEGLRMFMPGLTYFNGTSISPINIWQPFPRLDTDYGYNYQGKALYHELVFKRRRAGCKEAGLDFIPDATVDNNICDNDPQGLAMRLALAQQKPYYYNRPWFKELDEYYTTDGTKQTQLADMIIENSKEPIFEYPELSESNWHKSKTNGTPVLNTTTSVITVSYLNQIYQQSLVEDEIKSNNVKINITFKMRPTDVTAGTICTLSKFSASDTIYDYYWQVVHNTTSQIFFYLLTTTGTNSMRVFDFSENLPPDEWINLTIETNLETGKLSCYYHLDNSTEIIYAEKEKAIPAEFSLPGKCYTILGTDSNNNDKYVDIRLNSVGIRFGGQQIAYPVEGSIVGYSSMTDNEFYSNYQLDYDTYAEALDEPL